MSDFYNYVIATEIYGNNLLIWFVAVVCACGIYVGLLAVRRILVGRFARRDIVAANVLSRTVGAVARSTQQFFMIALALGAIGYALILPSRIEGVMTAIVTIAVMLQIGVWATALLGLWIAQNLIQRAAQDPESASAAQIIKFICLVAIWSAILLLLLGTFGIDVTGLVAGLGVGGIAIAFALQSILKDLFASLAIVLDKPFVVGDFIIFGEQLGSVERIGLKTTRVRSLWGEQVTVSNDDLLSARVHNYKRMSERRISFNVRVIYETTAEMLEEIPHFIRELIDSIDQARFDRSHVAAFEDYGHRIETVYYVLSPDYNVYMDIQQRIHLGIVRHFAEKGVTFGYPARRLIADGPTEADESAAAGAGRPDSRTDRPAVTLQR